ncbi:hypothetical protein SteCoe_23887 [Stentor coeruleus]|uniref:non-specific serine/threonine protein kinase n=1 Tax=Stentor coeruleus TaxID=5963 RepID=A0A1R2BIT8_9CILI|nr:hypothetical protein SteCoe_23887 [Stentor coeruleus]
MERITLSDVILIDRIYSREGICEVYKGTLRSNPSEVICVKKLFIEDLSDLSSQCEECYTMAKLEHQNIIKFRSASIEGTRQSVSNLFIYMEYFPEGDLQKLIQFRIQSKNSWTENELLSYAKQLVSAYSYLQSKNICHRDIKPQNIFVTNNGTMLKVGDFGASRNIIGGDFTIIGTPLYVSPLVRIAISEQVRNNRHTLDHDPFKSDVYSLGLVFLYMASLKDIRDLASLSNLDEIILARISALPREYRRFQRLLWYMLAVDEKKRPCFNKLESIMSEIISYEEILCEGCCEYQESKDFYVFFNEKMCRKCVDNYLFFPDNKIFCSACGIYLFADLECNCGAYLRCSVCKDFIHYGKSCYNSLFDSVPNRKYYVKMICNCGQLELMPNPPYSYYLCPSCGYFCVVCGFLYGKERSHKVCEFMLKYRYLL